MTEPTTRKADPIAVGDLVMLNSGGPRLTVQSIDERPDDVEAICQWFAGKQLQSARIPIACLRHVEGLPSTP